MTRFTCLGSACPDTCCSGWNIPLSGPDLEALQAAVAGSEEQEARFEKAVQPGGAGHIAGSMASLRMEDGGLCGFLDTDGLCSVQKQAGEGAIPTVCGLYPKRASVVEARLELTLNLSCPEAARIVLTERDAVNLVEIDPEAFPRLVAHHIIPPDPEDPYERYYDDVRATILRLLSVELPFDTRLFLVGYFCNEIEPFFGRNRDYFDEGRLASVIQIMSDGEAVAPLCREYGLLDVPEGLGMAVAYDVFAARAAESRRLASLFSEAHETYAMDLRLRGVEVPEAGASFQDLLPSYWGRAEKWERAMGSRLERYWVSYAASYWMQGYLESPSLLEHMRTLILQCAILKFFLFGDSEIRDLDPSRSDIESEEALDRAVTRVVYRFTRATEHDPTFHESVGRAMDARGFTSFAHLVSLLGI